MGGLRFPPKPNAVYNIYGASNCLKPEDAFWTSTAIKENSKYVSSWVRWVKSDQKSWLSKYGFLFRVKESAKILTIHNDSEALEIHRKFLGIEIPPELESFSLRYWLCNHFPWHLISSIYDGVCYDPDYSEETMPIIMWGWDCESTAWFSMRHLELIDEIEIG